MTLRKIILLIALVLSVGVATAQTDIFVVITNTTNNNYTIKIKFNQDVVSDCSDPVEFQLPAGSYNFPILEYCFDEIDVNIESIECIPVPNTNPNWPNYPTPSLDCNAGAGQEIEVGPDCLNCPTGFNWFHFTGYPDPIEISPGYFAEGYIFVVNDQP
ncbi:MAG: hypothetical protein U9R19_05970 [Bacteroidota bacterium]|nr:hypothetical protein [Bacteroidota bacterium]